MTRNTRTTIPAPHNSRRHLRLGTRPGLALLSALITVSAAVGAEPAAADPTPLATVTYCVGGPHCYPSVQAALDAAPAGATVRIGRGSFAGGIKITRDVKLIGESAHRTKIVGGGPVVTIGSTSSTPTVRITNLTITGGVTTTNPHSPHCGPDVPTCGPGYPSATALAGGIEAFAGTTVTIVHSVVTGNRAKPALSVPSVRAVCPGQVPCPASFGDAAGIDVWGMMTVIETTVSDNHASGVQSNGGGIVVESGGSLIIRRSAVVANSAAAVAPTGRFASGGGIFVDHDASLLIDHSRIAGNAATLANSFPAPYPTGVGGPNDANSIGGAIFLTDGSSATIRNSVIRQNSVRVDAPKGGPFGADSALCACGSVPLVLLHSRIDGNRLTVNVLSSTGTGPSGSAIEVDGAASITDVRVTGNRTVVSAPTGDADTLGAIGFFAGEVGPTVTGLVVADNTVTAIAPKGAATIEGAGITNDGPLTLTRVTVTGNRARALGRSGTAAGGGIWNGPLFGQKSRLTITDSRITHNAVTGSRTVNLRGGGLFTVGAPTTLTRTNIANNSPDQCSGC